MRNEFVNRNVLVLGYGISGRGAEEALRACGASVTVLDEKDNAFEPKDEWLSQFGLVIVSPSVASTHPVYARCAALGIEIYGELELGFRLFDGIVVAVTGTNGKTTTTSLIGQMLKQAGKRVAVCGNIGVSFAKTAVSTDAQIAVVEVSSFQLESIVRFRPHIAVLTNLSADHLDRHGSMEAYAQIKCKICQNQTESDYLVVSDEIPIAYFGSFCPRADTYFTSLVHSCRGAFVHADTLYCFHHPFMRRDAVKLSGDHNLSNILNAVCACKLLGIDNAPIAQVLAEFAAGDHRVQLVARKYGKNYYNDSKGTNAGATLAACKSLSGTVALILGGKEKNCDYTQLFASLAQNVTHLYAIGETAVRMQAEALHAGRVVKVCDSLLAAVNMATQSDADNVLLSPATSSFDMFADYKARGKAFEQIVLQL